MDRGLETQRAKKRMSADADTKSGRILAAQSHISATENVVLVTRGGFANNTRSYIRKITFPIRATEINP